MLGQGTTASHYRPGAAYTILDLGLTTGTPEKKSVTANADGTISLTVDGAGHQISIVGAGTGAQPPSLLPLTSKEKLRLSPRVHGACELNWAFFGTHSPWRARSAGSHRVSRSRQLITFSTRSSGTKK